MSMSSQWPPVPRVRAEVTPQSGVSSQGKVQDRISGVTGLSVPTRTNGHDYTQKKGASDQSNRIDSATTPVMHASPEEKSVVTRQRSFSKGEPETPHDDTHIGDRGGRINSATTSILHNLPELPALPNPPLLPQTSGTPSKPAWMVKRPETSSVQESKPSSIQESKPSSVKESKSSLEDLSKIDPPEIKSISKQVKETHAQLIVTKSMKEAENMGKEFNPNAHTLEQMQYMPEGYVPDSSHVDALQNKFDTLTKLRSEEMKAELKSKEMTAKNTQAQSPVSISTRISDIEGQLKAKKAESKSKNKELNETEKSNVQKIETINNELSLINAELTKLQTKFESLSEIKKEQKLNKEINIIELTITEATKQGKTVALSKKTKSLEIVTPENDLNSTTAKDTNYEAVNFILKEAANLDPLLIKKGYDTKVITALNKNPILKETIENNSDLDTKMKKMANRVTDTLIEANKDFRARNLPQQIIGLRKIVQDKASHDLINAFIAKEYMHEGFAALVKINEYKNIFLEHPQGNPRIELLGKEIMDKYIKKDNCNLQDKQRTPLINAMKDNTLQFNESTFDNVQKLLERDTAGEIALKIGQHNKSFIPSQGGSKK